MVPIRLVLATVLAVGGLSAWATAQPVDLPPVAPPSLAAPAPPTAGTVTADLVNVRCGPNLYYYPLATVSQGARVAIRGEPAKGWLAIDPPEGVYGLVRRSELALSEDGATASASVPSARVYAAGPRSDRQWCVMATLAEGDKVKVLGPGTGEMLRVGPPESARAYITSEFVKVEAGPPPPPPPPEVRGPVEPPPEVKVEVPVAAVDPLIQEEKDAEAAVAEELKKPVTERDYGPLLARFAEVAGKAEDPWLKRRANQYLEYLKVLVEHKKGYLDAMEVDTRLHQNLSSLHAGEAVAEAEAARRAAQMARFDAVGTVGRLKFADAGASSPINHKLVDSHGRILYVLRAPGQDLDAFVGKVVGVRGSKSYVRQWNATLITVEAIEEIE
jgi:hypothetical protein